MPHKDATPMSGDLPVKGLLGDRCNVSQQWIQTPETRLSYWEYEGSGQPLIFCHGAGLCGRTWDPVITHLDGGYPVLAWDARGHGDSSTPEYPNAYGWQGFSKDLLAMLDQLGLKKDVLAVGHSGGASTLAHAALLDPHRFAGMLWFDAIIADAAFFASAQELAQRTLRRRESLPSLAYARSHFGGKAPMNRWTAAALDAYLQYGFTVDDGGAIHLKCRPSIEAQVYGSGGYTPLLERLCEIRTPVLLVTGSESYMTAFAEEQHRRLAHSELLVLPNTGHFIPQEQPLRCAELITAWARGLCPSVEGS